MVGVHSPSFQQRKPRPCGWWRGADQASSQGFIQVLLHYLSFRDGQGVQVTTGGRVFSNSRSIASYWRWGVEWDGSGNSDRRNGRSRVRGPGSCLQTSWETVPHQTPGQWTNWRVGCISAAKILPAPGGGQVTLWGRRRPCGDCLQQSMCRMSA